jgi:hypothetical protein
MSRLNLPGFALMVGTIMLHITAAYASETDPSAQVSRQDGVTMTVVAPVFSGEAATWDFSITLESHVQSLDDELTTSSTLVGDGKPYRPAGWIGDPPGGHHRKGLLRFKPVTPLPQTMELQVRRQGEPGPRIFRWKVK